MSYKEYQKNNGVFVERYPENRYGYDGVFARESSFNPYKTDFSHFIVRPPWEENSMITHVQVQSYPFALSISSGSVDDALSRTQEVLRTSHGFQSVQVVPTSDIVTTQHDATLSVKITRFTDKNGNVHVPDAQGNFVPADTL